MHATPSPAPWTSGNRRILIVGGGISGLTLAIALAQKGITVDVAEITPDGNVLGIGILLAAPALRALDRIGLVEQCIPLGFAHRSRTLCNMAGEVLNRSELPRLLGPQYPAQLGIRRSAFHRLLLDSCREQGVPVRFGLTVSSLQQRGDGVDVHFSDGSQGAYEAVIGADGAYSSIRTLVFGAASVPTFQGIGAWRLRTARPATVEGMHVFDGGKHGVGFNPVTDTEGYIFVVESVPDRTHYAPEQLVERVPSLLVGYGGLIAELLPTVKDPAQVLFRPIDVLLLEAPWYRGNVLLIGDAAHAPSPQLASGALLAIEDAVVLAEELSTGSDITTAFERFMARRYERCKLVVDVSVQLAEWQRGRSAPRSEVAALSGSVAQELLKPI